MYAGLCMTMSGSDKHCCYVCVGCPKSFVELTFYPNRVGIQISVHGLLKTTNVLFEQKKKNYEINGILWKIKQAIMPHVLQM
jgi:hypothetical protein